MTQTPMTSISTETGTGTRIGVGSSGVGTGIYTNTRTAGPGTAGAAEQKTHAAASSACGVVEYRAVGEVRGVGQDGFRGWGGVSE